MLTYTLTDSNRTWGDDGVSCWGLTLTDTASGETRACDDFTYFEADEAVTQAQLTELWEQMA
jgi:hypothetical protein